MKNTKKSFKVEIQNNKLKQYKSNKNEISERIKIDSATKKF